MSPLQWNSNNNVGYEPIDTQHREWVRIFNALEESILSTAPSPSHDSQLQALKDILEFTREHFLEEERLMSLHGYPEIVRHRRMHKDFENQLYEKFRMVMAGELVLTSEILAMIRHWFIQHTSNEDTKAFHFINNTNHVE